jgi:ATP-binding cassette subfamily C protein
MILDDVSFHVAPGEHVAIVGASGAGKSTILRLVLGLVTPTSGRVLIDGRPVAEHDLGALRAAVGTVLAGGAFFDAPVFDNVALGAPDASPADVQAALTCACVEDVVSGLPRGALTPLGAGASRLSGGQRQRLLLARALAKRPSLLLLDEASSALDDALEARIQERLDRLPCTMLMVAHRRSAIAFANRVLVLERAKITRECTPTELRALEVQGGRQAFGTRAMAS